MARRIAERWDDWAARHPHLADCIDTDTLARTSGEMLYQQLGHAWATLPHDGPTLDEIADDLMDQMMPLRKPPHNGAL